MHEDRRTIIQNLVDKKVCIPAPATLEIDDRLEIDRISGSGVTIHAATKILGTQTIISKNCEIGREGPVTIENCYLGPGVTLKSGYFKNAVFLEGASLGYGSHVREGTILEEQANTAHCVGLKQTILFPFVTLGSLINFCDCLMAGGTSRKSHSEVGSSFIHFNFTPNQDKATPSLIGDVPRGVMLDQRPIFLGGQGGLVGPCRINYGTVSAAGTIVRKDQLKPDHLVLGGAGKGGSIPWKPGSIGYSNRVIENNLVYMGNLFALREWYRHVRRLFISDRFPEILLQGLCATLDIGVAERFQRLHDYCALFKETSRIASGDEFDNKLRESVQDLGDLSLRDRFLSRVSDDRQGIYIDSIQSLPNETRELGTQWLQSIVDKVVADGAGLKAPRA